MVLREELWVALVMCFQCVNSLVKRFLEHFEKKLTVHSKLFVRKMNGKGARKLIKRYPR